MYVCCWEPITTCKNLTASEEHDWRAGLLKLKFYFAGFELQRFWDDNATRIFLILPRKRKKLENKLLTKWKGNFCIIVIILPIFVTRCKQVLFPAMANNQSYYHVPYSITWLISFLHSRRLRLRLAAVVCEIIFVDGRSVWFEVLCWFGCDMFWTMTKPVTTDLRRESIDMLGVGGSFNEKHTAANFVDEAGEETLSMRRLDLDSRKTGEFILQNGHRNKDDKHREWLAEKRWGLCPEHYRKIQNYCFRFLEMPRGVMSFSYHALL